MSDRSQASEGLAALEVNDGLIVEAVLRGDNAAFETFVHKYQGALLKLATNRLNCPEQAEEAVQETFLSALRSLHTYNSKFAFRTWLWTILLNQCRRIGSRVQKFSMQPLPDEQTNANSAMQSREDEPSFAATRQEASRQLKLLLEALPPPQAEAIRLRFFEGLKFREIAETMHSSLSSAKKRVRSGLETISDKLDSARRPQQDFVQPAANHAETSIRENER